MNGLKDWVEDPYKVKVRWRHTRHAHMHRVHQKHWVGLVRRCSQELKRNLAREGDWCCGPCKPAPLEHVNTFYAERQLKVAKAAEDQEASELTLFMRKKLTDERRERIVTAFSQLLRLYAIAMCSCLVVFTPQKCGTGTAGETTQCSTEQNVSWDDIERRNVLAVNFFTGACMMLGELLYFNREIWMIRRAALRVSARLACSAQYIAHGTHTGYPGLVLTLGCVTAHLAGT